MRQGHYDPVLLFETDQQKGERGKAMNPSPLSRRGFMLSLVTSVAVLPLGQTSWRSVHAGRRQKGTEGRFLEGPVRLNANENPLGPSPRAIDAMERALDQAHRYTQADRLRAALASYHQVAPDMILLGCGSTEILRIAPSAFLTHGGELVTALQTYQTLVRECRQRGVEVVTIPLNGGFTFDLDSISKGLSRNTGMVYLVNPNNPTGTCLRFDALESFCRSLPKGVIVFLDEAYHQFLPDREEGGGITLVKKGCNVIVTRTFSKAHGMAGMRLGYAVSDPSTIERLSAFGLGDLGINQAALAGGIASLEDQDHVENYLQLIDEGRRFYYEQFDAMGLKYIPSRAPFLMVRVDMSSAIAQRQLAARGVLVRNGEDWHMPGFVRISIGLPEENGACVQALKGILMSRLAQTPDSVRLYPEIDRVRG
jgi:histidinol-phosphate aminotransferase